MHLEYTYTNVLGRHSKPAVQTNLTLRIERVTRPSIVPQLFASTHKGQYYKHVPQPCS